MLRLIISALLIAKTLLFSVAYAQRPVAVNLLPDGSGFTTERVTISMGNGFYDHGVASPISNHRGVVATVDGQGKNVVLVWLFDHRGGYALLMIDAKTGKSEEFPVPFDPKQDTPYSSILSSQNKLYTLFRGHFVEFDPVKRAFTFVSQATPQMTMAMTEDDQGKIWAVTYPSSGLVSFDPKTRIFKDFKSVNKENWAQYHLWMAADDAGWVYFGLGKAASQIFAFDPVAEKIHSLLPEGERQLAMAKVVRDVNGKVYGTANSEAADGWYEFYKGKGRKTGSYSGQAKAVITGSQQLFHRDFPDGAELKSLDLVRRELVTTNKASESLNKVTFNYSSDGAIVMGVGKVADGTIVGGTAFPMRFFSYDLKKDKWINRPAPGQFNALATQDGYTWFAVYPRGNLLEWNPSKSWFAGSERNPKANPRFLTSSFPDLIRPFRLMAHPDGKTIVMGGSPQYGATGGALMFWDRQSKTTTLLKDSNVVLNQSTISLVPLGNGLLLGGSTTTPGSGGERKAHEAVVYIMDMVSKKIVWQKALFPKVQEYSEMRIMPGGLVYGIADKKFFFVFDAGKKEVVHQQDLKEFGPTTAEQSPRIFVSGPEGQMYLLFRNGSIVEIMPKTYQMKLIAKAPAEIKAGGDYADGRIFFVSGSHLFSYQLDHDVAASNPTKQLGLKR